ncbi:hypothetical protein [Marivita sp. XM-24bin2]|uniref:hypothetical protein n=1 Tax=Marivita sp. XM-24bin2 TaxID=2133951 RepID=UPI0025B91E9D|nr:hypothetical protein [Marivita sp. XM-24bin2]
MPLALMMSASRIPIKLPGYDALTMPRGVSVAAAKIIITSIALASDPALEWNAKSFQAGL